MTSLAIKYSLFLSLSVFYAKKRQTTFNDTSRFYYKIDNIGVRRQLYSLDNADFYRLIITPDSSDVNYVVNDFYKGGQIKFTGHYNRKFGFKNDGVGLLDGACVGLYADGKTQSTVTYSAGDKIGLEYIYFPDGRLYTIKKYFGAQVYDVDKQIYLECYDRSGVATCKNRNGQWTIYDSNFKSVLLEGNIKNGVRDGEWKGATGLADSIKYIYKYKKGELLSGTGFDKTGRAYPFTSEIEGASCRLGVVDYLLILRGRIELPKDASGSKVSIDNLAISFIIETDGRCSNIETIGSTDSVFEESVKSAVLKGGNWNPRRYFGIPLRTKMTIPLKYIGEYAGRMYLKEAWYQEQVLGF